MLEIAKALAAIEVSPVFVGGLVTGLLVTDAAAPAPRPTDDIDLVVEVLTHVEYHALGKRLRSIGFAEDTGSAVLCRWIFKDHAVDVMPTEGAALGMSCRWFSEAYAEASRIAFDNGRELRAVTAPYFLALKLEAFRDRGRSDYEASHDLEDLIAVVDGRPELEREIAGAESGLRAYLAERFAELLAIATFREAIRAHLGGDETSQARAPLVETRLRRMAQTKG